MSALAHYIEAAGLPTTLIALVREHAAAMRPPRALWTSFELGRPVGAPDDPAFQRRVLQAALGLLERPGVPVLEDYPEDAPDDAAGGEDDGWVCPVSFAQPAAGAPQTFTAKLAREVAQLKPWHETWKRRRPTTVGATGAEIEAVAAFLGALADGAAPPPLAAGQDMAAALKLAVTDLMAYCQEAANAQPGAAGGSQAIADWFWGQTVAGATLLEVRRRGGESDDARFARVATRLILPHIAADHAR